MDKGDLESHEQSLEVCYATVRIMCASIRIALKTGHGDACL